MESIEIQNFGPINDAKVVIKDLNIFIGTTSSGKSTVAKLISIFKGTALRGAINFDRFTKLLADFNIDFRISNLTKIRYEHNAFFFEVKGKTIQTNYPVDSMADAYNSIYVPAERIFFSTISQSIFSLMSSNVSLPKWIIDFGAKFEQARNSIKKFSIDFLDVAYEYDDSTDYIKLAGNVKIKLSQASSGLQSVIPLILVVQYNTEPDKGKEDIFVIEEPELNLYPSSQKDLIEYIISRINQSNDKIIITTHSPYLLTSIDNLIQANNVAGSDTNIELLEKVKNLIPYSCWIDFNRVSCYYFNDGGCKSTLDDETRSIGPSNIDDVSIKISDTFERLLVLKYPS
jgi:predicted ATPase